MKKWKVDGPFPQYNSHFTGRNYFKKLNHLVPGNYPKRIQEMRKYSFREIYLVWWQQESVASEPWLASFLPTLKLHLMETLTTFHALLQAALAKTYMGALAPHHILEYGCNFTLWEAGYLCFSANPHPVLQKLYSYHTCPKRLRLSSLTVLMV